MGGIAISTWVVLWAGAFVGGLAAGGAGFAFALVASSIWLHALEPKAVTALVVACGSLLHVGLVWPIRRAIEPRRLAPFLAGGAVGIPLGIGLLTVANPDILRSLLGVFLTAYSTYALTAPRLPVIAAGRFADMIVGTAGGILGGLGGFSGVLPTIWTQVRGWPKDIARGVYQPFILAAHVITLIVLGVTTPDPRTLVLVLGCLPPLLAGAGLGLLLYARLDERRFKQVLCLLLIASGLPLIF